ncbi:MAG TPA: M17 family peptidase N-terminal domain-containing protein, partial [Gemmatimonadaceae bacterium]|nr:M17 family peptidase N-terminal domain-containing protein [Gemmatimonadaceae bacterium]
MLKIAAGSSDLGSLKVPALALLLEQPPTAGNFGTLDANVASAIQRVIARRDFRGGRDETLHLLGSESGIERVLLVGMGKVSDRSASLRRAAAIAARRANQLGFGRLAIFAGDVSADDAEALTLGAIAGAWEMKEYQTPPPEDERRSPLTDVT